MKPIKSQTAHYPKLGFHGDCLRACVASLLEMPASEVPHFFTDGCDANTGWQRADDWLERVKGLTTFTFGFPPEISQSDVAAAMHSGNPGIYYILTGGTASGVDHAVIMLDGNVAHNPSPGSHIIGPGSNGHTAVTILISALLRA